MMANLMTAWWQLTRSALLDQTSETDLLTTQTLYVDGSASSYSDETNRVGFSITSDSAVLRSGPVFSVTNQHKLQSSWT